MQAYHDHEWGKPVHDSRKLWAKLMLDGFQAGLSWATILNKREAIYEAFEQFDPEKVARFTEKDIQRLLQNEKIIRSRRKIESTILGAQVFLRMQADGNDFSKFCWSFTDGKTLKGDGIHCPTETELSRKISQALKKQGFKFVGPVIVYAWMQAVGIVNDHSKECFCR